MVGPPRRRRRRSHRAAVASPGRDHEVRRPAPGDRRGRGPGRRRRAGRRRAGPRPPGPPRGPAGSRCRSPDRGRCVGATRPRRTSPGRRPGLPRRRSGSRRRRRSRRGSRAPRSGHRRRAARPRRAASRARPGACGPVVAVPRSLADHRDGADACRRPSAWPEGRRSRTASTTRRWVRRRTSWASTSPAPGGRARRRRPSVADIAGGPSPTRGRPGTRAPARPPRGRGPGRWAG